MTIDARGARENILAIVGADVVRNLTVTSGGSAYDLSSATLTITVRDVSDYDYSTPQSVQSETSYSQTITDAAAGEFTFKIPKTAFAQKSGQEMSYQLLMTESGNDKCLMSGSISVQGIQ